MADRWIEYPFLPQYAIQRAHQDSILRDIARRYGTRWAHAPDRRQFVQQLIRDCFPGGVWEVQVVVNDHDNNKNHHNLENCHPPTSSLVQMDPRHAEVLIDQVSFRKLEKKCEIGCESKNYFLTTAYPSLRLAYGQLLSDWSNLNAVSEHVQRHEGQTAPQRLAWENEDLSAIQRSKWQTVVRICHVERKQYQRMQKRIRREQLSLALSTMRERARNKAKYKTTAGHFRWTKLPRRNKPTNEILATFDLDLGNDETSVAVVPVIVVLSGEPDGAVQLPTLPITPYYPIIRSFCRKDRNDLRVIPPLHSLIAIRPSRREVARNKLIGNFDITRHQYMKSREDDGFILFDKEKAFLSNVFEKIAESRLDVRSYLPSVATRLTEPYFMVKACYEMWDQKRPHKLHQTNYEALADSFKFLFCRTCCRYDCHLHGSAEKPDSRQQLKTALLLDGQKEGMAVIKTYKFFQGDQINDSLTPFQRAVFEPTYNICQGNHQDVALFLGVTVEMVDQYVNQSVMTSTTVEVPRNNQKLSAGTSPFSIRQYPLDFYKAACTANFMKMPYFNPCNHSGDCTSANCTCVRNNMFCTVACCNRQLSKYFFRGCECLGDCSLESACSCRAANRECDPEICKCRLCKDGSSSRLCRNANILNGNAAQLLVAESDIAGAGYGCFTKNGLKKGDFIAEYVGEIVSQDEAERRGQLAEAQGRSYLFDLSSDMVIDSTFYGNETRFINHADNYNVYPRSYQRIGFYASRVILPHEELTFDYGKRKQNRLSARK